ncbi:hypothetical protein CHS0354_037557 [Potamilus streckersoni]|uniref:Cyclic nucleotide-binding domain-containing protein n=1 Tax=Potamilus streckersoni TaxID=2493646 RepID=A0AAE0SED7_9BIVA|nr:hypothetical protein CHS0354_037557 [Potamilus streckersoni]
MSPTSLKPPLYTIKLRTLKYKNGKRLIQEKKLRPPTEAQSTPISLKKRDSSKTTKLFFLGINETIGEAEVLLDMDTYIYTAVCTEKTEVLVLEMKHYERLFVKRHSRTIESMCDNLGVKLEARKSLMTSKEKSEIPLFGLLQKALHLMNNPAPPVDKRKKEISVQSALKQFINHKGPLLDIHGPGSVFYMIRKREESKLKFKAYQKRRENPKVKQQTGSQMHSITLPHSLLMAAGMLGATRTNDSAIDTEPKVQYQQNRSNNAKTNKHSIKMIRAESSKQLKDSVLSGRRIHSATQTCLDVKEENSGEEDTASKVTSFPSYLINNNSSGYESDENEAALSELEQKVLSWLRENNPKGGNKITKLRRLALAELEQRPKPGNKIVIRRRYKLSQSESMMENRPPENTAISDHSFSNTARISIERYRILLSLTK